jgi:GT2 family glycosyltransferase
MNIQTTGYPARPAIAVITLCGRERDGWINPALMLRVVECVYDGLQARRPVAINLKCGVSPAERARNQIAQEFLATPASWLIQLDNDCIPPSHFLQLIDAAEAEGKFLFGVPAPMITEAGLTWNVVVKKNEQRVPLTTLPKGWNRCDWQGGAFLAIHRSVLEAIKGDWFTRTPTTTTEDFAFSERATEAGFQPWFHGDYQCEHLHSVSLLEMLNLSKERGTAYYAMDKTVKN